MGKIVGFEIGDHSVKLVYFAGNELKKSVCAELPDAMVSHGRILSMDAMADFLRDTARANGIPRAGAAVSLSLADAYTRDVTMPAMTEQQLAYNLPFEFHDFLTEEKSKYFFDYSVREVRRDPDGYPLEMDLFACAMLKERVEAYRAMFRRAGFKLKVLAPLECAYGALMAEHIRRTRRAGNRPLRGESGSSGDPDALPAGRRVRGRPGDRHGSGGSGPDHCRQAGRGDPCGP